jgi:uncharacterized protein
VTKITDEMKQVAEKAEAFNVATTTKNGEPNVVPISFAKVLSDDELLLMDSFMRKTIENIKANPRVAISVWEKRIGDSIGYQFKGSARIETSGRVFDEGVKWVRDIEPALSPKAAIIVTVDSIYMTTPGPDAGNQLE